MAKDLKAIEAAISSLEKRYGERNVMKMSDAKASVKTFSSGRADLDLALGGGYGVGKIVEIYSEEACGKTGLALEAIKSVQSTGGLVGFIDAEHALNTEYAEQIGVDIKEMYICQPTTGEEAFETVRGLISSGQFDLIVIDSVSALVPLAELNGEVGEAKMAVQARMMSQGMKVVTGAASESGCTLFFINQLRDKIGTYVPTKTTSGGNALKFYASQRIEIKRKEQLKEGDEVIGFKQHIRIVKNKIATPYKTCESDIIYGKGVDSFVSLIDACLKAGVIVRAGAFYKFEGSSLAQGMANLRKIVEDHTELVEKLKEALKK